MWHLTRAERGAPLDLTRLPSVCTVGSGFGTDKQSQNRDMGRGYGAIRSDAR